MNLLFKPGVKVEQVNARLLVGLAELATVLGEEAQVNVIMVTSVNDGKHKKGSFHYTGNAVDVRCRFFKDEDIRRAVDRFNILHDAEFDLIWEDNGGPNEHLHLERDPR